MLSNTLRLLIITNTYFVLMSCAAQPPQETGNFRQSELVEIKKLDTSIHLDIRYATPNNIAHQAVYKQAKAFLQKPAAEALVKVNASLKKDGYGLLVFDGYRPWSVTKKFWDVTAAQNRKFVADPKKGSKHNRGCAVDLSLYNLRTGKEVQMTGAYDEMSERSYSDFSGGTTSQRATRDLLRQKMEAQGFAVIETEWWHFDYKDWKLYHIENIPFEHLN